MHALSSIPADRTVILPRLHFSRDAEAARLPGVSSQGNVLPPVTGATAGLTRFVTAKYNFPQFATRFLPV